MEKPVSQLASVSKSFVLRVMRCAATSSSPLLSEDKFRESVAPSAESEVHLRVGPEPTRAQRSRRPKRERPTIELVLTELVRQ
jgi:hypothetical protein